MIVRIYSYIHTPQFFINNNTYLSMTSYFSVRTFLSCILHHLNYLTSLHTIPNRYIKVSPTFKMMCLKNSPPNILNIVGISITLAPHINMQHAVVSYETLHKYRIQFSMIQHIRMLQKATTPSVTHMHRSCGYI